MLRSVARITQEPPENINVLSEAEREFVLFFGTKEKPMTLSEFMEFWNSLNDDEQYGYLWAYENEKYRGRTS